MWSKIFHAIAFGSFGALTVYRGVLGDLSLFVFPLYIPIILAAALCTLGVALIYPFWERQPPKGVVTSSILLCVSLLGFTIPPGPLSAATAESRGVTDTFQSRGR